MRHKVGVIVLVVLGVLLTSGSARAEREMDFARGLIKLEYLDLALEQLARMEADTTLPKKDRILLPLVTGQVYVRLARLAVEPTERNEFLLKASSSFKKFEAANPSHPRLLDVSLDQARILFERAGTAADSFRAEGNPERKKKLLVDAEGLFKQAAEQTSKVVTILDTRMEELLKERPRTPTVRRKMLAILAVRVKALLQLGDMEYLHAALYGEKSPKGAGHLNEALKAYDTVAKERPSTNFTFLACVRRGMCLGALAPLEKDAKKRETKLTKAMESFNAALKCKREPSTIRIRLDAFSQKAQLAFATRKYETGIAATDSYLREAGERISEQTGQELLLLRARCQAAHAFALKDQKEGEWRSFFDDAVKSLQAVGPQFPALRAMADNLVQEWLPKVGKPPGTTTMSVFVLANRARKFMGENRVDEALDAFQRLARRATTPQDSEYAAEAWLNIGTIYFRKNAYYEATLAWHKLIQDYRGITEQAADLGYYISQLFGALYEHNHDTFDLDQYLEALEYFVTSFPKDNRFFEATSRLAEVYEVKGRLSRAASIWAKADVDNPRYVEAMVKSGELYWQDYLSMTEAGKGDTPEARQALKKAREQLARGGTAPVVVGNKVNWSARGLFKLAELLTDRVLPQPEYASKTPAVLDDIKTRFRDVEPARRLVLRVKALCIMKKPAAAERYGETLARKYAGMPEFQDACRELMVAFQDTGNAARSAVWQKKMILNIDTASDSQLEQLGQSFWGQKQYDEAIRFFARLEKRLKTRGDADSRKKLSVLEENLATVYFEAGRFGDALPYYERFHKRDPEKFLYLRRLAECLEEGGRPEEGLKHWAMIQDKLRTADPKPLFFEARLHMVRCLFKVKKYRQAIALIKQTQVLYGGFGPDKKVNDEANRLLREMGG